MKELDFKEIWKAPFHSDELYIFSSNNVMTAANFSEEKGEEILSNICKALNGEEAYKYENVNVDGCELTINGVLIVIRGWGHLTGVGGLHLHPDEAAKVQDKFIKYIIDKISK